MDRPKEWYHEFFDDLYAEVLANQFPQSQTLRQVRLVKRLLKLRRGQHVLDIPCGLGRIAFPLAEAGIKVVGSAAGGARGVCGWRVRRRCRFRRLATLWQCLAALLAEASISAILKATLWTFHRLPFLSFGVDRTLG